MYVFTVIVSEYLGQYCHHLVNFTFYENKFVRQEVGLLYVDIYIQCNGYQF